MTAALRGASAIVGIGLAGMGEAPGFSPMELLGQAVRLALDDAGIALAEVDGLFTANLVDVYAALSVGEYLGLRPRFVDATNVGGSSFLAHAVSANLALANGLCDVALICYGSNQRSAAGRLVSFAEPPPYEAPYRPRYPIVPYALAASRHMHEFGTTRRDLAAVAVAARAWARLNPAAFARDPLSIDDVLAARMVCDPLGVRDCCLVTDGAGAIVLVRADRARSGPKPPAFVLGGAAAQWHRQVSAMADLTVTAAQESGRRACAMAGLGPDAVDVVQLYDAFTINTILFLEDLGFCPKGEGGRFVADGAIAPGGRLPVNTNGGGLSCVHPGMYGIFALIEAVEQLRGTAGDRQVPDAAVALCHGNGVHFSSEATVLLGTDATV